MMQWKGVGTSHQGLARPTNQDAFFIHTELQLWAVADGMGGHPGGDVASRLVVDTGLHAKRWTREQAIAYGIRQSEVDRYVVMPGQACSYKIGQMKFLELREEARAKMGARFTLKGYHNVALGYGRLPLTLLELVVREWARG